jgi:hypothetical protein
MANQFASTVNAAVGTLKIFYEGPIVSQFNDELPFYKHIEKSKQKWNGLQLNRPLKVRRNPGIGATSDGGVLPSIGFQTTIQAVINAKYNYLRAGLTGPMLKASQGDKGAFVSQMSFEMDEGMKDLVWDIGRQLYWDGTGTLATLSANAVATNVITATGRESTEAGNKFLDVGYTIDIYSTGGVLKAQGAVITALSGTTTVTLTLNQAVTAASGDIIVRSGAYNQEIQGILTTLGTTQTSTIYSVDRSTYPSYQGNALSNAGAQLSLDFLQQLYNAALSRGGKRIDAVFSDFNTERMYNKLLVADKRYVNRVVGDGTFSSKERSYLEFGGVAWVADQVAPTRVFMLDSKTWEKAVLSELEWADETGAYMIAQSEADAFEMRLRFLANLFCEKPGQNAAGSSYISP